MVLWDSRTVHDNARPTLGREHSDRWRFVVFVSMTPARWASHKDLAVKQEAYSKLRITTHWSSQGLKMFGDYDEKKNQDIDTINALPDIAKTKQARILFGIEQYDFEDGSPNGHDPPKWRA